MVRRRTLDEIRREGLEAQRERLGRAGLVRFLQQFETGRGDYAAERRASTGRTTLFDIKRQASNGRKRRGRKGGKKAA